MLGHTRDEASLFLAPLLTMTTADIQIVLHKAAMDLDIDFDTHDSPIQLVRSIFQAITHNAFIRTHLKIGTTSVTYGAKVYVDEFAVPDPFSGPPNDLAWHSIGNPI